MSQAEKPNTTKLSRRSALAGLSLFATASVATIAAGAALGDDAELLALAAQFEPLYAEWLELRTTQQTRRAKFEALLAPSMRAQLGEDGSYSADEYRDARRSAIDEIERAGLDPDNEDLPWDDFHDRFFPLFHEIFSYFATTREGLALQIKAILCRDMDGWEYDEEHVGTFVEGVCLLVGVEFPQFPQVVGFGAASS
jgi:hypothetical protein